MSESENIIETAQAASAEESAAGKETRYNPAEIEPKWQERWAADPELYGAAPASGGKPKY